MSTTVATPELVSRVEVILANARRLISDPERWIQGDEVGLLPDGNHSYCAIGAIHHASDELEFDAYLAAIAVGVLGRTVDPDYYPSDEDIESWLDYEDAVPTWNDNDMRTHKEVLGGFDKALSACSRELTGHPEWL